MKKTVQLFILFIFIFNVSFGQTGQNEVPYSFNAKNLSHDIPQITFAKISNEKCLREDEKELNKNTPLRIGIVHHVNLSMENCGMTDALPNGDKLWRILFKSEDAVAVAVNFQNIRIPEGAFLYAYSPDKANVVGKYTQKDFSHDIIFSTEDIPGDEIVLEYYEPANAAFKGEMNIDKIGHIYREISSTVKGPWGSAEGDCHINVKCPEGDNWRSQINSVVLLRLISNEGIFVCSGAMINNVRMDKTPYVFSADHCYDASGSYTFYFLYQTSTCEGNTGISRYSASGGVLVAHDTMSSSSDFLLMKITGNLKDTYRDSIYFSGWDISGGTPSAGSAIHHPGGDFKKISIPNSVFSGAGSYSKYWGVNWITGPNNKGVTEKGSSGSPLYNANGLIVGSLSFGSSGCDALYGKDYYGKISYSWNNNNHPNVQRRLKPWLDPDNTGVTSIQGMTYSGMVEIEKHNNAIQELQVFPNPSSGDNISISGNFVDYTGIVNVYNQMGQLVYAQSTPLASSFNLDLKQLNNGLYFIEIVCKKHIYKAKIMIIK